jgi:cyclin-dependent kinase-like
LSSNPSLTIPPTKKKIPENALMTQNFNLLQEMEKEKKPKEFKVRVIKIKGGKGDISELKKLEYEGGHCQQDAIENVHALPQDLKPIEPPNPANPSTNSDCVKDLRAGGCMMMPAINLMNSSLTAANLNQNLPYSNPR